MLEQRAQARYPASTRWTYDSKKCININTETCNTKSSLFFETGRNKKTSTGSNRCTENFFRGKEERKGGKQREVNERTKDIQENSDATACTRLSHLLWSILSSTRHKDVITKGKICHLERLRNCGQSPKMWRVSKRNLAIGVGLVLGMFTGIRSFHYVEEFSKVSRWNMAKTILMSNRRVDHIWDQQHDLTHQKMSPKPQNTYRVNNINT